MEHNRVLYRVVQTANPTGWKWTVDLDAGRKKSGVAHSRESAILGAVRVIDRLRENREQDHSEHLSPMP